MREVYTPSANIDVTDAGLRPWKWHEPTGYVFMAGWRGLASDSVLRGTEFRLLCGLISYMGWRNRVMVSVGIVARAIGMSTSMVTEALRRLETAQLIEVDRSDSRGLVITVSPMLLWQGRPWHLPYARDCYRATLTQRSAPAALPLPTQTTTGTLPHADGVAAVSRATPPRDAAEGLSHFSPPSPGSQ